MVKNEVELVVMTTSGTVAHKYDDRSTLQEVEEYVFAKLHIQPSPQDQWQLIHNGTVLSLGLTIAGANLHNGAKLTLAPREGGGGTWMLK